jgi:hypothetical protein
MSIINPLPALGNIIDFAMEKTTTAFYLWLNQVFIICFAQQQSGTTAQRPIAQLYVGRRYFDTTLGYPVWVKSVNSSHVATWVNGAGTAV